MPTSDKMLFSPMAFPWGAVKGTVIDNTLGTGICNYTSEHCCQRLVVAGFTDVSVVSVVCDSPVDGVHKITHYVARGVCEQGVFLLDQPQREFICHNGEPAWELANSVINNHLTGPWSKFKWLIAGEGVCPAYFFMTKEELLVELGDDYDPDSWDNQCKLAAAGQVTDVGYMTLDGEDYAVGKIDGISVRYCSNTEKLFFYNDKTVRYCADNFVPRLIPVPNGLSYQQAYNAELERTGDKNA